MYKILLLLGFFFFGMISVVNAQSCPFGITDDPAPGQCGRYVDHNDDGYCDLGETEPNVSSSQEVSQQTNGTVYTQPGANITSSSVFTDIKMGQFFLLLLATIILYVIHTKRSLTTLLQWMTYYILPLGILIRTSYGGYVQSDGVKMLEVGKTVGYLCFWLLYLILIVKPLYILIKPKTNVFPSILRPLRSRAGFVVSKRKELGILVFRLALGHTLTYILFWRKGEVEFFDFFDVLPFVMGTIGGVALLVGRATSNTRSMRYFRKYRKPIQMSAYGALVFSALHIMFINTETIPILTSILLVYLFLKVLEVMEGKT